MNYTNICLILCFTTGVLWMYNDFLCVVVWLLISLSIDVHLVWRNVLVLYFCRTRRKYKPKKLTDSNIFKVICLPTDIDNKLQLTTGRLLRECGANQSEFWIENYVQDALASLKGNIKMETFQMTYDCPIKLFQTFKIIAEILYWDDTTFYMKQTVLRNKDKKVCATMLSIHRLTDVTTSQVIDTLGKDKVGEKPVLTDIVRKLQDMDISKRL